MKHVSVFVVAVLLAGCAPQRHNPVVQSQPIPSPPVAQEPIAVALAIEWQPMQEPPRRPRRYREKAVMSKGGKEIVYKPGQKHVVSCADWGSLAIMLPEGETLQGVSAGNSGEWQVEPIRMGNRDAVTIKRSLEAPRAKLDIITDAPAVYEFILSPQKRAVSKNDVTLFDVINRDTENRLADRAAQEREDEERYRQEQAERIPQADFSSLGRE